jgi:hypothetical protein
MKKKYFTIFIILSISYLFVLNIYANQFGIKSGIDVSYLSNVKFLDTEFIEQDISQYRDLNTGLIWGAFYKMKLTRSFSLQPEIYVSKKRLRFIFPGGGELTFKLDYIEIPLLLKYSFPLRKWRMSLNLFSGIVVSLTSTSELQVKSSKPMPDQILELENTSDSGLVIGIGLDIHHKYGSLILDTRFNLGMTDLVWGGSKIRKNSFSLMVGFGFGKK